MCQTLESEKNLYPQLIYTDSFVAVVGNFFCEDFMNFYSSVNAGNRDGRSIVSLVFHFHFENYSSYKRFYYVC